MTGEKACATLKEPSTTAARGRRHLVNAIANTYPQPVSSKSGALLALHDRCMVNTMRARIDHISDCAVQSTLVSAPSSPSFPYRRVTVTTTHQSSKMGRLHAKALTLCFVPTKQFATEATGNGEGSLKIWDCTAQGQPMSFSTSINWLVSPQRAQWIFMHTWPAPVASQHAADCT